MNEEETISHYADTWLKLTGRFDWCGIPSHMRGGIARYVLKGIPPGQFLTALLENDFMEAAGRADMQNLANLDKWATFLYNFVPTACRGDDQAVRDWCKSGGLEGAKRDE